MTNTQSAYREIVKSTSIIGGVQVFNILITVIKSKFVAVLLGPTGMGIMGLLTSTIGIISGLTNFGLGVSAVKNVAAANGTGDHEKVSTIVTILRKWVWVTGLLGMIITVFTAPILSQLTFGNRDYTYQFIWLSISLLFKQLSSGQMVVLQGLRKLQYLAKANLIGSIFGLFISIALFWGFGIRAITLVIILSALTTLVCSWYFSRSIYIQNVQVSRRETFIEGKDMLRMGFLISLTGLLTSLTNYLIRIYINDTGGVSDVGLYAAGDAIMSSYLSLVFMAMGTDYYPRLAAVAKENKASSLVINQQAEVTILILAPLLAIFLIFVQWIILVLYSSEFTKINGMIQWMALGLFFKASSWSIAFVFLAKGESKLFFLNESFFSIFSLGISVMGYKYFGITGLGFSYFLSCGIYLIQVFLVTKIKYQFNFTNKFYRIFITQLVIGLFCFLSAKYLQQLLIYIVGVPLIFFSIFYSYKELDKRMDLKSIIRKFIKL